MPDTESGRDGQQQQDFTYYPQEQIQEEGGGRRAQDTPFALPSPAHQIMPYRSCPSEPNQQLSQSILLQPMNVPHLSGHSSNDHRYTQSFQQYPSYAHFGPIVPYNTTQLHVYPGQSNVYPMYPTTIQQPPHSASIVPLNSNENSPIPTPPHSAPPMAVWQTPTHTQHGPHFISSNHYDPSQARSQSDASVPQSLDIKTPFQVDQQYHQHQQYFLSQPSQHSRQSSIATIVSSTSSYHPTPVGSRLKQQPCPNLPQLKAASKAKTTKGKGKAKGKAKSSNSSSSSSSYRFPHTSTTLSITTTTNIKPPTLPFQPYQNPSHSFSSVSANSTAIPPYPVINVREPILQPPKGTVLQVNNYLILIPENTRPEGTDIKPNQFEQYTCRLCRKTYNGRNARSVARRHLQDKHGVPLGMQERRSRWDRGEFFRLSFSFTLSGAPVARLLCLKCLRETGQS